MEQSTVTPIENNPESSTGRTPSSVLDGLSQDEQLEIYRRAQRRAWVRMSLYIHGVAYVVVMAILAGINLAYSPDYLWVKWPALGWGLGVFFHWLGASRIPTLAKDWEEREIVRELERRR